MACQVGTYRPDNDDLETCQSCPDGSTTTTTGRLECSMYTKIQNNIFRKEKLGGLFCKNL